MLIEGGSYAPVSAKIVADGKYTQFVLPMQHRVGNKYRFDGYMNILAKGTYGVFREGDEIKLVHITGLNLRKWGGAMFYSAYADIEYKSAHQTKASVNEELLDELPDDLV